MGLLKILFGKDPKKRRFKKLVRVYLSEKEGKIIIAPFYRDYSGIHYEQEQCAVLPFTTGQETLSVHIQNNLDLFKIKHADHRKTKTTDWPAYKASKLKSVKSFDASYKRISLTGANEANIIFIIEGESDFDKELNITSAVSANSKEIGRLVLKVYNACLLLKHTL
jgi:hypothetical protein